MLCGGVHRSQDNPLLRAVSDDDGIPAARENRKEKLFMELGHRGLPGRRRCWQLLLSDNDAVLVHVSGDLLSDKTARLQGGGGLLSASC